LISDRASSGVYKDEAFRRSRNGSRAVATPWRTETRLIPDERPVIESTLVDLVDRHGCHLVLTTGGTGPAPGTSRRGTLAIADKRCGIRRADAQDQPRVRSTAILSRQVAVVRKRSLIINLPGQPKSIRETLEGLKDGHGKQIVAGIFAAVPTASTSSAGPTSRRTRKW